MEVASASLAVVDSCAVDNYEADDGRNWKTFRGDFHYRL